MKCYDKIILLYNLYYRLEKNVSLYNKLPPNTNVQLLITQTTAKIILIIVG